MQRSSLIPLYVLLVFLSGALVGGVGYRLYSPTPVLSTHKLSPEEWRRRRIEEMRTRLKLSDEQVAKIQAVYDDVRQRVAAYDQRTKAELKALHEQQTQMIRSLLTDEQRVEYDKLRQEREEKARQKRQAEEKKNHP